MARTKTLFYLLTALLVAVCLLAGRPALAAGEGPGVVMKGDGFYRGDQKLGGQVEAVASEIGGPIRHYGACEVSDDETVLFFFAADGTVIRTIPLNSPYEFRGVTFSPDGKYFVLGRGGDVRPDVSYELYGEAPEALLEFTALRMELVWLDPHRLVYNQIGDDIRDNGTFLNLSYGVRLSVVLYEVPLNKTVVLKEATDTQNFWLGEVVEDGAAVTVDEESVKTPADWDDENKIEHRQIRVEIPAAG